MARPQYTPPSAIALFCVIAFPTVQAWTYSTTNVNLTAPPPQVLDYVVENMQWVGTHGQSDSAMPCEEIPVPPNIHRTPWPINGSRLTYSLINNTVSSLRDAEYMANIYLGQISLGNGSYTTASQRPGNYGFQNSGQDTFRDFETGVQCSDVVDVPQLIADSVGKTVEEVNGAGIEGMNATFGLRMILFTPNPDLPYDPLADYNMEEMYQCAYVTFTSADISNSPDSGYCNGYRADGVVPAPSSSASISLSPTQSNPIQSSFATATRFQTSTVVAGSTPLSTVTGSPGAANTSPNSNPNHTVAIGVGVSVSISAALGILWLFFWFMRQSRKRSGTVGADTMVSGPLGGEDAKVGESKKAAKDGAVESSSNSVHSEPLPAYSPR